MSLRLRGWLSFALLLAPVGSSPSAVAQSGNESEASTDEVEARPYPEGINCVFLPRPTNYSVIDDQHLVIDKPGVNNGGYLITLTRRCWDLETTFEIGLDRRGSQLCGPGDAIITEEDRCMIRYIEEVEDLEEATEVVEAREAAEESDD